MALLVFLAGGTLLALLVRAWRPGLSRRTAAVYLLVTAAFFAAPLSGRRLQVPTDIAYQWRPWAEEVERKVVPENGLLGDIPLQMLPFRTLVRERLLRGVPPLWANELGTGQPLLGNAQSAPFAPLHLLALPLPPLSGLSVAVAWQVLLSLLLMHALLAALGAGETGAAFGAVAYSFSSYAVAWAYHPIGMAVAWVPGVLLGLVLLRREERGALPGLVACAAGLALSGHPETLAHAALAAAAVTAGLLVRHPAAGRPGRVRFLARALGGAALAFCLSAPALLPFLEQLPDSERVAAIRTSPGGISPPPFERSVLLPLVDPLVFGSPRDRDWEGPGNFNEVCSVYAGLTALALALAGAVAGRARALAIVAGGLAALLTALRVSPFYSAIQSIPGLEHGAHARLRLLWVLAVAVAAGLQLERVQEKRAGRLVAAFALAAAAGGLLAIPPMGSPWQRAWWLTTLAGAALTLLALLSRPLRPWFPRIALACLALDLFLLGFRYQPAVPRSFDLAPPPALAYLAAEARRAPEPFRVVAEGYDLMPNLAAVYGLWDPRGNDPMRPAEAARVVGRRFQRAFMLGGTPLLSLRPLPTGFLDYLGVRFLLARHRRELGPPWEEVADVQGGRIWRNPEALPLFYLPASASWVRNDVETMVGVMDLEDFAATVFAAGSPTGRYPQRGTVALRRVEPNRFDLAVSTPTGGLVASSVSASRGWRLALDGQPAPLTVVNGAFLGFRVTPGRHRAVLLYRPTGWVWGLALLGVGLCVVAAWAAASLAPQHLDRPALQGAGGGGEAGGDRQEHAPGDG